MNPIDLTGKVALVTGAARGIGAATASLLAQCGAKVALTDVLEEGRKAAEEIDPRGERAIFFRHDVTDESQWREVVTTTVKRLGGLDILVNNAAVEQLGYIADIDTAQARRLFEVNVMGLMLGHKYAARVMRPGGTAGRGGSIVNLSSIGAQIGTSGVSVYSASKGAVRLFSKCAAVEFGQLGYGIRVNSIYPGFIKTTMGDNLLLGLVKLGAFPDFDTAYRVMSAAYPIGRTGVPRDIAGAVLFLASDLSSFVTGAELVVDGGMTIA
jgi:NAD(P)-dependent dehydrogenase (short-subunit alcohol dehydrogenase family)